MIEFIVFSSILLAVIGICIYTIVFYPHIITVIIVLWIVEAIWNNKK